MQKNQGKNIKGQNDKKSQKKNQTDKSITFARRARRHISKQKKKGKTQKDKIAITVARHTR